MSGWKRGGDGGGRWRGGVSQPLTFSPEAVQMQLKVENVYFNHLCLWLMQEEAPPLSTVIRWFLKTGSGLQSKH